MISFCCNNCGRKIDAKDELAGTRGKCPGCRAVIVVPEKTILVNFNCENCGAKIGAPSTRAGRKGTCPKCKVAIVVPAAHSLTLLDVGEQYRIQDRPAGESGVSEDTYEQEQQEEPPAEEDESAGVRNLPWFIDIFLYPTSAPGLTHLAIFTFIPLLIDIVGTLLCFLGLLGYIANILISLYLCWYITECVRDSALGGTRAPEAFATAGLGEMWSQAQHIIGCYLILVGPPGFYYLFTGRTDVVFWPLLAYGVFFLPIGLLACVMFDSIRGLNPVLLIPSILSTFFQYCGLVLLLAGIVLIFGVVTALEADQTQQASVPALVLGGVFHLICLYAVFVVSHLLGRFYWRNQDKLNWEV